MNAEKLFGNNFCVTKAGLAAGTTTTITITNNTTYSVNGKAYTKAAASNAATPTTDAITGAAFTAIAPNKGGVFAICLNAGGDIKVAQGGIADLDGTAAGASASFKAEYPQFPTIPDTLTCIGYLVTKVGASGAAWTFGTSNLAGPPSNVLHTFVDVLTLPSRPQAS